MNKKKVLKIVLAVLLSLIPLLVITVVAVFQFVIKPHTKEIATAVEQVINDPEFIEEFHLDEKQEEDLQEELQDSNLSDFLIEEGSDTTSSSKKSVQPKKPQSEYSSTYDYVKDNVDANDFKTGVAYASRVDIAYILGLLKGGLTVPEKRELKAYLKERFTNQEINTGISLYNKYSYLLK